jgi:hypothetical protein
VFVPDPSSHRHAVAVEPGTTVLTFGGPPMFSPSGWEWSFRAGPLLRTDPRQARAILSEGLEAWPVSPSLHYNLACLEAIQGNREAALAALEHAISLRSAIAGWAREDSDFQSLSDDAAFRALLDGDG